MHGRELLPIIGLISATTGLSWHLDRFHQAEGTERYTVPREDVVRLVATDFENALADVFWIQFLQYNGQKLTEDPDRRVYEHLWEGLSLITGLDRKFRDAYVYGSWVLGDAGQVLGAKSLIARARQADPMDPRYPFQLGFIEFLYLRNSAEAIRAFQLAAELASRLPDDKGLQLASTRMAAGIATRRHRDDLAVGLWRAILRKARETGDERMAEIANRALKRLGVDIKAKPR